MEERGSNSYDRRAGRDSRSREVVESPPSPRRSEERSYEAARSPEVDLSPLSFQMDEEDELRRGRRDTGYKVGMRQKDIYKDNMVVGFMDDESKSLAKTFGNPTHIAVDTLIKMLESRNDYRVSEIRKTNREQVELARDRGFEVLTSIEQEYDDVVDSLKERLEELEEMR